MLQAHCAAGIADFKVPRHVVVVEEFPSVDGPNGRKILKRELRERAAALVTSDERAERAHRSSRRNRGWGASG